MVKFKEIKLYSESIFKGQLLDVRKDSVQLPNGGKATREWIKHPGAICCVPILPDGRLALIKQYRYSVQSEMIEIPAGKLDPNEKPEDCAVRELKEEIGFHSNKLTFLTIMYPAIGFANEKMWLYLAEDLVLSKAKSDSDEFIELIPTEIDKALKMIWDGKITDVKTIIGLLWLEKLKLRK